MYIVHIKCSTICSKENFSFLHSCFPGYKSFGTLEKLTTIDFSHNMFDNSIVPFLSAATSLRNLHLESNYMEGVFPTQGYVFLLNVLFFFLDFFCI